MAKKSRRTRKTTARNVSRAAVSTVAAQAAVSSAQESVAEPSGDRQEYAYVMADIRQVAILAGAMFVLLIGLSFFIG